MPAFMPDHAAVARDAHVRHLRACVCRLQEPGWEQSLGPLATHMASKALVRARGNHGAPLRRLDLGVLRAALSRLLSEDDDDGLLIYQLVVEGADPAVVAQEWGISRAALVEELRDAVDVLAAEYEDEANQALDADGDPALLEADIGAGVKAGLKERLRRLCTE
jgi:hypothetical protein